MSMNTANSIRPARPDDKAALLDLAGATGLFQEHELGELEAMLSAYFDGSPGSGHHWIVDDDDGLQGAAYYAPEMMAEGTWNLYFIGVRPESQGLGRGAALLRHVEGYLRARGERLLLVETSGTDGFEATRRFYRQNGYEEEARIRDFYGSGDDKVVFRKAL